MANLISPLSTFGNQSSQDVIVSQQQSIVALQQQVNTIQSEVTGINSGLQGISTLIQNDNLLDQTRLLEEQKREKLLAESRTRIGKEEELEKRLEASLVKPVQALEPKLTSVFDRVSSALKLLFSGFLGRGVIQGISGVARFAIQGFTNVRSFVGRTLGFVGNTIGWLRNGLNGVVRSIGGVIGKVGSVIATLAKSPFKFIANLFKRVPGVVSRSAGAAAGAAGATVRAGGGLLDDIFKGGLGALKGLGKAAPLLGGAAVVGLDIATGEDPKKAIAGGAGAVVGGGLGAFLGAPLGPVGSFVGAAALGTVGQNVAKTGYEAATQLFGGGNKPAEKPITTTNTPRTPSIPSLSPAENQDRSNNFNLNVNPSQFFQKTEEGAKSFISGFGMMGSSQPDKDKPITPPPTNVSTPLKPQAEVNPPSKLTQSIGSLPEPKPNVIMASTVTQNPPRNQNPPRSGPLTDVPLISSFNSDNFYTLYAQTHYNVVI